jgi:Fur family ferric uptake transcriptional regulator
MAETDDSKGFCVRLLEEAKLGVTLGRLEVLSVLRDADAPLVITEIHHRVLNRGVSFSLASVYNSVAKLQAAGVVAGRVFDGHKKVYALAGTMCQNRLTCVQCGRTELVDDPEIASVHQKAASRLGFTLDNYTLSMSGVCQHCRSKSRLRK